MKKILLLIRPENSEEENKFYQEAILKFGGEVEILYDLEGEEKAKEKLKGVFGILLPGGNTVGNLDFFLIDYALKNQIRFLGICQGMQSMALYHTDNQLVNIGDSSHNVIEDGYIHEVILSNGLLKKIVKKDMIFVNSHHLQTVNEGGEFVVTGKSSDGLIEVLENPMHPFQIGVQWHPERMIAYDEDSRLLFQSFLEK